MASDEIARLGHDELVDRLEAMEARTCAACTHWAKPAPGDRWELPGSAWHAPEGDRPRWGWCNLIGLPEYGEAVTVTAYTKDGSDYKADLYTRDDFGCTLHEPRPPATQETGDR